MLESSISTAVDVFAAGVGSGAFDCWRRASVSSEVRGGGECIRVAAALCQDPCCDPAGDPSHGRLDRGKRVAIKHLVDFAGDLHVLVTQLQDQGSEAQDDSLGRGGTGHCDSSGGQCSTCDVVGIGYVGLDFAGVQIFQPAHRQSLEIRHLDACRLCHRDRIRSD